MLGHEPTLRSKTPQGVRQELWGALIAFNLIRQQMAAIAAQVRLEPTRISFSAALYLMRDEWDWIAVTRSPGAIPKHLRSLEEQIKRSSSTPQTRQIVPSAL